MRGRAGSSLAQVQRTPMSVLPTDSRWTVVVGRAGARVRPTAGPRDAVRAAGREYQGRRRLVRGVSCTGLGLPLPGRGRATALTRVAASAAADVVRCSALRRWRVLYGRRRVAPRTAASRPAQHVVSRTPRRISCDGGQSPMSCGLAVLPGAVGRGARTGPSAGCRASQDLRGGTAGAGYRER